jgi:formylglycine-generating enzyme required for sulfatase activity
LCAPGGSFTFGGTIETPTVQASVSSFYLDVYEVTVARFRAFVNDYDVWHVTGANPKHGDGSARMNGSGWNSDWSSLLPANAAALRSAVKCEGPYQTWTDTIGTGGERREEVPMNCVTWYEAFAFCVWDGGRLPTETEWEFAASGGAGRLYPWGSSAPTADLAVFGCLGDGDGALDCTLQDILAVGSKPNGAGAFGHRDLAGSIYEWVFDRRDRYDRYPATCNDCANTSEGPYRARRGGDWLYDAPLLRAADRSDGGVPTNRTEGMGVRCVRAVSANAGLAEARPFR